MKLCLLNDCHPFYSLSFLPTSFQDGCFTDTKIIQINYLNHLNCLPTCKVTNLKVSLLRAGVLRYTVKCLTGFPKTPICLWPWDTCYHHANFELQCDILTSCEITSWKLSHRLSQARASRHQHTTGTWSGLFTAANKQTRTRPGRVSVQKVLAECCTGINSQFYSIKYRLWLTESFLAF